MVPSRAWLGLLGRWLLLAGPTGFVLYVATTFLFAFSGGQHRMVPVVQIGPWVAGGVALLIGGATLATTRSLPRATRALGWTLVVAWVVVIGAYWALSFRFGARPAGSPNFPGVAVTFGGW